MKSIGDNYTSSMHRYLMKKGFPYHSVSVVNMSGLGYCCIFTYEVKHLITDDVIAVMKGESGEWYAGKEFDYIINKPIK